MVIPCFCRKRQTVAAAAFAHKAVAAGSEQAVVVGSVRTADMTVAPHSYPLARWELVPIARWSFRNCHRRAAPRSKALAF